jgi:hypothetical protein
MVYYEDSFTLHLFMPTANYRIIALGVYIYEWDGKMIMNGGLVNVTVTDVTIVSPPFAVTLWNITSTVTRCLKVIKVSGGNHCAPSSVTPVGLVHSYPGSHSHLTPPCSYGFPTNGQS